MSGVQKRPASCCRPTDIIEARAEAAYNFVMWVFRMLPAASARVGLPNEPMPAMRPADHMKPGFRGRY